MAPFVPHLCEEIWERIGEGGKGGSGLISGATYPEPQGSWVRPDAERTEAYIMGAMEDVAQIRKMVKGEVGKVVFYTAPPWKWDIREAAIEMILRQAEEGKEGKGVDMGSLMKLPAVQEQLGVRGKETSRFVGGLVKELNSRRSELAGMTEERMDEKAVLAGASRFLAGEFGLEVSVYMADEEGRYDPKGKAVAAAPMRPAIYLE
jgi:leucyl-tRNA synthetase